VAASENSSGNTSELIRIAAITLGLLAVFKLLTLIPLPFTNKELFKEFGIPLSAFGLPRLSIVSLGIIPYTTAYMLVEIFTFFIPYLKKLREVGHEGRLKLKFIAMIVTFFLSTLQGYAIVNALSHPHGSHGFALLPIQNAFGYIPPIATLVGGVFLVVLISELISIYGIGHGISLLMLLGPVANLQSDISTIYNIYDLKSGINKVDIYLLLNLLPYILLAVSVFIFLNAKRPVMFDHRSAPQPLGYFQLNFCPSGVMGLNFSVSLISSMTIFFPMILSRGTVDYYGVALIFTLAVNCLFAWFFLKPKARFKKLSDIGWTLHGETPEDLVKRVILYNLPWTLLVYFAFLLPDILGHYFGNNFYHFSFGGSPSIIGLGVAMDILDRIKINSKTERLVKVAEIHDVYEGQMIKNHLAAEDIRCHLQGLYHRSLLYFLGPYIEISLMVSQSDRERVEKLLSDFYEE
jgi:preprotein translocase subunit SecY